MFTYFYIAALKSIGRETGAAVSSRTANTRHNLTVNPEPNSQLRRNSALSSIILNKPRSWMQGLKTSNNVKTVLETPSAPAAGHQHNHELRIDQNGSAGHKKAERWHQTCSTFEMSFLKKSKGEKQKQKINESNLT